MTLTPIPRLSRGRRPCAGCGAPRPRYTSPILGDVCNAQCLKWALGDVCKRGEVAAYYG